MRTYLIFQGFILALQILPEELFIFQPYGLFFIDDPDNKYAAQHYNGNEKVAKSV